MNPGLTFGIETLGCKLNFSESSTLSRQLEDAGFAHVSADSIPDIFVLNTCSVTDNADKKCRSIVRKVRQQNPNIYTIVTGCYAQLKPKEILDIEGVNLVVGAGEKFNIPKRLSEGLLSGGKTMVRERIQEVKQFFPSYSLGDRTRSFLKVQDGCDYFCTFCTIPLARGKSRSPEVQDCVNLARELAEKEVKEVVLTGVNIGDFHNEKGETFFDLVKALDQVKGIERFRISSIEPNLLSDEIIRYVAQSKRFVPHFHIPLQSGSDRILKAMRRKYESQLFANRIQLIKSTMPDACIGVDVIVGFPGETEADYLQTYNLLDQLDVSYLHVFTYSERPNTGALKLEGRVDVEVRRQRNKKLRQLSARKKAAFYKRFENSTQEVLFEQANDGYIDGFTRNYIKVRVPEAGLSQNSIQKVQLNRAGEEVVYGEVAFVAHNLAV